MKFTLSLSCGFLSLSFSKGFLPCANVRSSPLQLFSYLNNLECKLTVKFTGLEIVCDEFLARLSYKLFLGGQRGKLKQFVCCWAA
jgi:hypothetical protein